MMSLPASQQRALNQIEKTLTITLGRSALTAPTSIRIPVLHCALYFQGAAAGI
jgi:hypothetical protein